ncbi:MAG: transposase [Cytophagaceae bacterium]
MKSIGIRSARPNEFLHVDTTYYTMKSGIKWAITFVSDNFSRKILGWSMALKNSSENVKNALNMALESIRAYHPGLVCATLVADGGSENHAITVKELLESTESPQLTMVVALKDIAFSNSPIEAINKIMKRYLRYYDPSSEQQLYSCLSNAVEDYSSIRPHTSLDGFTPMEVYSGSIPDLDFRTQIREAKNVRILMNRKGCGQC